MYVDNTAKDEYLWRDNDELKDYTREIKRSWGETIEEYATKGADIGGEIGSIFGNTGRKIGEAVGGIIGGAIGVFKEIFGGLFRW